MHEWPFKKYFAIQLILLMVFVCNVPNMIPWEGRIYSDGANIELVERLIKAVLLTGLFFSLFRKLWVAWVFAWVLCLWWMPVSVATRFMADSPITSNLIGVLVGTDFNEVIDLFLAYPPLYWVGGFAWNVLCLIYGWWLWREKYTISRRQQILMAAISVALASVPVVFFSKNFINIGMIPGSSPDKLAYGDEHIMRDADFPVIYPYELPWSIYQYTRAQKVVDWARKMVGKDNLRHREALAAWAPEVFVLVIGESSYRGAWHIYNNSAPLNNKYLEKRIERGESLHVFDDVSAVATMTRQVVPSLISDNPLIYPDGMVNEGAGGSILSIVKKLGYTTIWLSNQSAVGRHDGVIAAYADQADSVGFFNFSGYSKIGNYDEVLLSPLKRKLDSEGRKFIVLHTLGSHFHFPHRYPKGFGSFPEPESASQHYYNTISYTDWFLNGVIEAVENSGRKAVVLYVADHGQGLSNGYCNKSYINRFTFESYQVPALIWLSPKYASSNVEMVDKLEVNKNNRYLNSAVFHTVKEFFVEGEVDVPEDSANNISFLKPPPSNYIRQVVSPSRKWIDYDSALNKAPCSMNVD